MGHRQSPQQLATCSIPAGEAEQVDVFFARATSNCSGYHITMTQLDQAEFGTCGMGWCGIYSV